MARVINTSNILWVLSAWSVGKELSQLDDGDIVSQQDCLREHLIL